MLAHGKRVAKEHWMAFSSGLIPFVCCCFMLLFYTRFSLQIKQMPLYIELTSDLSEFISLKLELTKSNSMYASKQKRKRMCGTLPNGVVATLVGVKTPFTACSA